MTTAWFIDGSYAYKCWKRIHAPGSIDYKKMRLEIESDAGEQISEAYYFNADNDPPSAKQDSFHRAIAIPPPDGAGLRVKLYWTQRQDLFWPDHLGGYPVMHPHEPELQFQMQSQKAVDVGLAFHMMRSFSKKRWDRLYLVAGDGDFHEVVQHLVEDEDVAVTLLGTRGSISSELGPYGRPIYLEDYVERLSRDPYRGATNA